MIKSDFTSHFIIVLRLMVILVSTLIMINSSVNSKWGMGYGAFYVICPRASSQYVTVRLCLVRLPPPRKPEKACPRRTTKAREYVILLPFRL